jgi:beclin
MYCQKCRIPLKLDSSLEDLNPAAFDLLIGSTGKSLPEPSTSTRLTYPHERKELYDQVTSTATSPVQKRSIPAPRHGGAKGDGKDTRSKGNPDMSFIEITESQVVSPQQLNLVEQAPSGNSSNPIGQSDESKPGNPDGSLSHDMEVAQRLFSILSARSDIDHPICTECTSLLLSSLTARLNASTRERDAYIAFLRSLQSESSPIPTADDLAAAEKSLREALDKEKAAFEELKGLEAEKRELEHEIAELEEQSQALKLEEQKFWAERNTFDDAMHDLTTTLSSLQQKHQHDQQHLQALQRTNVYNDTFCIGHDGYFGTINGLRLGRLPNQNVEWSEINAAWGQTVLLLATVAERLGYTFQGYRLRPMGSTSRIEKIEWPQQSPDNAAQGSHRAGQASANPTPKITQLDLFSSGDMPLGRVFFHRRFDGGMVAFLDCLSQLGAYVERLPNPPSSGNSSPRTPTRISRVLPYPINSDKIGEGNNAVSIKLGAGFQQDESWTKACKYALTCCKFLLAHVSNMGNTTRNSE